MSFVPCIVAPSLFRNSSHWSTSSPADPHVIRPAVWSAAALVLLSYATIVHAQALPGSVDAGRAALRTVAADSDREFEALGIRKITGKHLTLYTDLPSDDSVDELPRVFDQAVPQWCGYFSLDPEVAVEWGCTAYLMQDKERFLRAGFVPPDLPPFLNGYQRGSELWVYEQPSAYYRRHLLLHEGTHGFMTEHLGGAGPPWYMEGMAELLATHRWNSGKLSLNYFPANKEEVKEWGRIKIVSDAVRSQTAKGIREILNYDSSAHLQVEPYGWCWALSAFLERHPVYHDSFRQLRDHVREPGSEFSRRLEQSLTGTGHAPREWQWYIATLDYGYDIEREAIVRRQVQTIPGSGVDVKVAADRGWQSSGIRLEEGVRYRIEAAGRYQVGSQPKPWWCEPNGVTIRYIRGRPLGMLLGAIVDESDAAQGNGFLTPAGIGELLETKLRRSGTLYLRINDAPSELADNEGSVQVRITPVP